MTTKAKTASNADRIIIFDTTLRDGEQSPGATMTFEEKLLVAECLDSMGIDVIEAGFPIASIGDFESVAEIAKRSKNAVIAGLAHGEGLEWLPRTLKSAMSDRQLSPPAT